MLHVVKVLCLILAAAVSSVAIRDLVFRAQRKFNTEVRKAERFIVSEYKSMTRNLTSEMEMILSRLDEQEQRDHFDKHTIFAARSAYAIWEANTLHHLSTIRDQAVGFFKNIRDEVGTYVVMYEENRIPADKVLTFIKEDKLQLQKTIQSATSMFIAVGEVIDNVTWHLNASDVPDDRQ